MIEELRKKECIYNFAQKIINEKLRNAIQDYCLHYFSPENEIDFDQYPEISNNIKNSTAIIIDQFPNQKSDTDTNIDIKDNHFVICFKKTLILIKQHIVSFIHQLFTMNEEIKFCFLNNSKKKFDENIKVQYKEFNNKDSFYEELNVFNNHILIQRSEKVFYKIHKIICPCLSAYFIKESYSKLNTNRITDFNSNKDKSTYERIIKEDDYIELPFIGGGSASGTFLIYHIEDEKLYAIKKIYLPNNKESEKLRKREIKNYKSKINHPFLPKFYGITKKNQYLVLEYINGQPLSNTDISSYSEKEIISIIFQILSVIEYLHKNHFIYRDLKPDNIMIDSNKNVVLIDFDRMLNENEINNDKDVNDSKNYTNDFSSDYVAPEVNSGKFSNKCDIYSIGKIINYIMKETNFKLSFEQVTDLCLNKEPYKRKNISEIIFCFCFILLINNFNEVAIYYLTFVANQNFLYAQYNLGNIYYEGKYISRDINKAIHYYSLAANQNDPEAQYILGNIYYEGKYISKDINKVIHYLTLAANQNNPKAQTFLGDIYSEGKYISRDINKAIHYYTLAANQNFLYAQYILGNIYYEGRYISKDINKAIYYLTLAANQNIPQAQYILGNIYYEGKYISRDINKAIYYYTLAANQNIPQAQNNLGKIYYEGKYFPRDINKAIHYYTLAANQNIPKAQNNLGAIYYDDKYISRDINKAIYYLTLAANQNIPQAQYNLGNIYHEGKCIPRDINKAIYYYTLAANQSFSQAQYNLGNIYYEGKYISRDINKVIHYYSLAANQNLPHAQNNLGSIYLIGEYIPRDINKAIYYYTLAANQNFPHAQYILGIIYYEGKYISRDINKAIYYLTLAANQNHSQAQYNLGFIYYNFFKTQKEINLGIFWILESSERGNIKACFFIGFLYQEGKHIEKDIKKSIHNYKEASSFNNQFAKNNLGIIYKHGIDNEIEKNTANAEIYFSESIKQKNDSVSMYNLAHLYIYEKQTDESIDKSINLLIDSLNLEFYPSTILLLIVLFKKYDRNIENIKKVLSKINKKVFNPLFSGIEFNHLLSVLYNKSIIEEKYQYYRNIDYLYNQSLDIIETKHLYYFKNNQNQQIINKGENITKDFYSGFNDE